MVQAPRWLVENGNLYQEEAITFNDSWLPCSTNNLTRTNDENCSESDISDHKGPINVKWSENETETPAGVTDTIYLIYTAECQYILNLAPGEGNQPLSIFRDKYSEELAYHGIFLGQKRPDNRLTNVHYSDICKSELRRSDRRAAMCVENIFFKTKKLQMKILLSQSQIALRKCKGNSRSTKTTRHDRKYCSP